MSDSRNESRGATASANPATPVHLAVDAHRLVCEPHTSGATYLKTLLSEWAHLEISPQVDLLLPFQPAPEISRQTPFTYPNIRLIYPAQHVDPIVRYRAQISWQQRTIPNLLRRCRPQVYFSPFHLTPQRPFSLKMVTAIHDLCFLSEPPFSVGSLVHRAEVWSACLRATRFLCVSQFTLKVLRHWAPRIAHKARAVPNGLDNPTIDHQIAAARLRALTPALLPKNYLLWIGHPSPRKNPSLLFAIFKAHHERFPGHKFVIVAPTQAHPQLLAMAKANNLEPALRLFDGVDNQTRDSLYRCALALVFPSICEGFGYPVLEAMLQGCPPFAIENGPAREMLDGLLNLPAEFTPQAFTGAMQSFWDLPPSEQDRVSAGLIAHGGRFSGKNMAAGTLQVLREAAMEARG